MERVYRDNGSPLAERLLDDARKRTEMRREVLQNHSIVDIMSLADPEQVRAGKTPIPSSKILPGGPQYYTPDEYRLHLQNIADIMEQDPNYKVILTQNPRWKDVVLYAKGDYNVLIVKDNDPCAIFEITEGALAVSFSDFIRQIANFETRRSDRQTTLNKLREYMAAL